MRISAPADTGPLQWRPGAPLGLSPETVTAVPRENLVPPSNLAARAGRWSAQHRKTAILGWLAFVLIATVLGGMVGQKHIAKEDYGNGQSRVADQAIAAAGFPKEASEQVLVGGKGSVGPRTRPSRRP